MKPHAVRGYILATSFINMYAEEHEIVGELVPIRATLNATVAKYIRKNKINIMREVTKSWDYFTKAVGESYTVSVLTFCLQLIIKNPDKDKNKQLTALAMRLNQEHLFSKDEEIKNAKALINKFYQDKGNI